MKALRWLAVADVWGIGRQHTNRLHQINVKTAYDFTQVPLASQDKGRQWKMKQEKRSPRYTTKLSDIIIIEAK